MINSLVILGASGSIGSQTISILESNPSDFLLLGFSVGNRLEVVDELISKFSSIKGITIKNKLDCEKYKIKYPHIKFFYEDKGLVDLIKYCSPTMVVNALVGFVGLYPTLYSLENNMKVALANKEALVVGGVLVNNLLKEGKGKLYPIDSEHSAIWKCLKVDDKNVDKLIITASGGALRDLSREELKDIDALKALKHPTWNMGAKITIDCATMVNKSFEIIEAYYLFNYKFDQVEVLLHDESNIHSMVKYKDGLYRAEISKPDMRNPIKFALYEGNIPFDTEVSSDYHKFGNFHFHEFKDSRYPMVKYADVVISKGLTFGAVYNATNEEAVYAFLKGKIPFLAIESLINKMMKEHKPYKEINYEILKQVDELTRKKVNELIMKGEY